MNLARVSWQLVKVRFCESKCSKFKSSVDLVGLSHFYDHESSALDSKSMVWLGGWGSGMWRRSQLRLDFRLVGEGTWEWELEITMSSLVGEGDHNINLISIVEWLVAW